MSELTTMRKVILEFFYPIVWLRSLIKRVDCYKISSEELADVRFDSYIEALDFWNHLLGDSSCVYGDWIQLKEVYKNGKLSVIHEVRWD